MYQRPQTAKWMIFCYTTEGKLAELELMMILERLPLHRKLGPTSLEPFTMLDETDWNGIMPRIEEVKQTIFKATFNLECIKRWLNLTEI